MKTLVACLSAGVGTGLALLMTACSSGTHLNTLYTITVNSTNPASGVSISVSQPDANGAANGSTSFTRTYSAGTSVTLTAPATSGGSSFSSWTGCTSSNGTSCTVTLSANTSLMAVYAASALITPTVTVTPSPASITTAQSLSVMINVSGGAGNPTPTGSVVLTSGSYTSAATALSSGSATITVPAGSLANGTDTLTATYTPNAGSSGTYAGATGQNTVTVAAPALITPTVTVTPSPTSITTAQSLSVTINVSGGAGNPTPTGTVVMASGGYTSAATTLSGGNATITVPAGALATGTDALTATYTPNAASSGTYANATGQNSVTVTTAALITPTVTVTPSPSSVTTAQSLSVTVSVSGGAGNPTPTGSVILSSGSYTSAATTLTNGSATITVPAGALATGTDTLTAAYTPNAGSSAAYANATGSNTVTVTTPALITPTVTVTPSPSSVTTAQSVSVTVSVSGGSGNPTPTGSVILSSGSYTSSVTTLASGSATITIPAGALATATDTLTANYTPDSSGSTTYKSATGTGSVTVTTSSLITPTVTVTPSPTSITTAQSLSVTISVSGGTGNPTPTGSIILSSGTYASSSTTLASGSVTITVPAGSLAVGTDTLTGSYTPDSASSGTYNSASGKNSVTVTAVSGSITVSINALANRHTISPFIYGGAYPKDPAHVTDSGTTFVRWGGNATSTYNWQLGTNNSGADYYYEDYASAGFDNGADASSTQFITDVENAGSHPLMTMVMLPWVAQSAETSTTQGGANNYHWSYSVGKFGAQCSTDPYNVDAGNGLETDCSTPVTTNAVTTAYFPLLDDSTQTCSASTCVYRNAWAAALATAFGNATCAIPYSNITSCHFYDMDNEIEIWGGTHRDIHPAAASYDEMANVYLTEAAKLKIWDPQAVRFGPVNCCWWFYWNGANGNDKGAHAGIDFVPWWLNQVYWNDQINGTRTLDVFDLHAYPDADTGGLSKAQLQALAVNIYRDYWDPTFVSPSGSINQIYTTNIQPNKTIPFRIPRMRAIVNMIYPGTPMAFTEWSAEFAGAADFSTALGDADAYGIFGRERLTFASRWTAPVSTNPNYQALKLYTNYDGAHHGFGTTSISTVNTGNPALFSSYAALDSTGKILTVMVLNKDPNNAAQVQFNLSGFNASSFVSYTLSSTASTSIKASASQAWTASQSFAPYTATLLVITGDLATAPVSDWDLNPDAIMVPAGGTTTLQPKITSGSANVTLSSASFDAYEGAPACSGTLVLTTAALSPTKTGAITVNAGTTPGFCHFTVTGSDGTVTQTEGGWIVVGNPPAALSQTGSGQTGTHGQALAQPLKVTLTPGQSGGNSTGASIFFTTSAGTLSNGTTSGTSVIAVTNSSGVASVTLTLPASTGSVTVQAQAPIALGAAVANFTETSQ